MSPLARSHCVVGSIKTRGQIVDIYTVQIHLATFFGLSIQVLVSLVNVKW